MLRVAVNAISLLSPFTGVGQYTRSLVGELQANPDLRVSLFYGSRWSSMLRQAPVIGLDGAKRAFKTLVPRSYEVVRAIQQIPFAWGARGGRFDLYHEPNFLGFRFNGPRVVTAHDLSWIFYPETHPRQRVANMNRHFPVALASAAHIITPSEFIRRQVMEVFGVPAAKISAIHEGARAVFRPRTAAACAPTMQRYALQVDSYLLSVGTLEPRKNLRLTIEAYRGLPQALRERVPLVIVGMRGWLHSPLERSLHALVQSGRVRVLGYVDDAELADLYAGCSAMVYPSLYEGFGLPPLEAMASGAPVVISRSSALPEVVGSAGMMVDSGDVDELRATLAELLQDATLRSTLRTRGLLHSAQFSWQRCAHQTVSVYLGVLGRSPPP